jgi:23S rRNA pseudouridine2605 synthase
VPPRYAYWTILIDDKPTAFRAREREELQPTLVQLQRKSPNVTMRWFARGKLWESREAERDDFQMQRHAASAPKEPRGDRPAAPERRGSDWRPGGTHKDPRDRFKKKNRPERAWSEKDPATQRDRDKPGYVASKPRGDWRDKPAGPPRGDRPWQDKPRGDRPWSNKPAGEGKRPWSGKPSDRSGPPRERKPWPHKPAPGAPPNDRPWQTKPTGPRAQRKPWAGPPSGDRPWSSKPPDRSAPGRERKPWSDKPPTGAPRGDRPWRDKPAGGPPRGDRPWSGKPPDRSGPPRGDRPADTRRSPSDRRPSGGGWSGKPAAPGGKRPWSGKPPASGGPPRGDRPWSGKPRDPNRKPFTPRGPHTGGNGAPPRKRRDDED